MVGREEPARDNGGSKLHPSAPTPRRRFHSGDRPQSVCSGGSPPKKLNEQSFFSKIRHGLNVNFGASFSSRRSSCQPGSSSDWRAPPGGHGLSMPLSEQPRIVGGFGRGFPVRPI
uniref:Uncharacterized protein n=1 Tax=Plectus sambesii TaxID=2011161 RepID=A0A914UX07_9BILA